MATATHIVFREMTAADFFNISKPRGAEERGGGQSYIDFNTSVVTLTNWTAFLAPVRPTKGLKNYLVWDVTVHSIGLNQSQLLRISSQ